MSTMSNYPRGFTNGISIRGMPIAQTHPGKIFWVDNSSLGSGDLFKSGSDANKGTYDAPFSTVDAAIGACRANKGDIIMVKPGHAETLSSATGLVADVAGVAIIGLGVGSNRPTFTLDTATTTTIAVSAANVTFKNIVVSANYADIVAAFTVSAKYFTLEDSYIKATATNMNFLSVVKTGSATANVCDGISVRNCKWIEPDLATLQLVTVTGTEDDVEIVDNYISLGVNNNVAAVLSAAAGKIVTNMRISNNRVFRLNTDTATGGIIYATDGTTSTGIIADNYVQHADTAAEILVTASNSIGDFENYASGVAGASGYILPARDS